MSKKWILVYILLILLGILIAVFNCWYTYQLLSHALGGP